MAHTLPTTIHNIQQSKESDEVVSKRATIMLRHYGCSFCKLLSVK